MSVNPGTTSAAASTRCCGSARLSHRGALPGRLVARRCDARPYSRTIGSGGVPDPVGPGAPLARRAGREGRLRPGRHHRRRRRSRRPLLRHRTRRSRDQPRVPPRATRSSSAKLGRGQFFGEVGDPRRDAQNGVRPRDRRRRAARLELVDFRETLERSDRAEPRVLRDRQGADRVRALSAACGRGCVAPAGCSTEREDHALAVLLPGSCGLDSRGVGSSVARKEPIRVPPVEGDQNAGRASASPDGQPRTKAARKGRPSPWWASRLGTAEPGEADTVVARRRRLVVMGLYGEHVLPADHQRRRAA